MSTHGGAGCCTRTADGLLLREVSLSDASLWPSPAPAGLVPPVRVADVRLHGGRVVEVGHALERSSEEVVEGAGAALLPGLHDHHLHLNAMAATLRSVDVGPEAVARHPRGTAGLLSEAADRVLRSSGVGDSWVRAVGHHEVIEGLLDRHRLDAMTGRVPTRVQHRGGALWILNSAALEIVARALDNSPDVERDSGGVPTGRLWRYDARLAAALPDAGDAQSAALAEVTTTLLGLGITGATDATPVMDDTALELLRATAPLRLHLLGTRDLASARRVLGGRVGVGARKLLLRDHDLPDLATLVAMIDPTSAGSGRAPVAVHCVTRDSAVLVAVALAECGSVPGDRIEHGAVLPPEVADLLATLEGGPPVVVTQPDLLRSRGDSYLESVPRDDQAHLYPWSGLHQHGLKVVASSDAPFGEVDPWQVVRSAAQRRTRAGRTIGASERVGTLEALRGYLTEPEEPAGPPRVVAPGAAADLVLADTDWSGLTADPGAGRVRQTFVASCCAGCTGQR